MLCIGKKYRYMQANNDNVIYKRKKYEKKKKVFRKNLLLPAPSTTIFPYFTLSVLSVVMTDSDGGTARLSSYSDSPLGE